MKIDPKSAFTKAASAAQDRAVEATRIAGEAAAGAAGRAGEVVADAVAKVNEAASSGMQKVMEGVYRPVFPEQYASGDYDRPKMVVIADNSERKLAEHGLLELQLAKQRIRSYRAIADGLQAN